MRTAITILIALAVAFLIVSVGFYLLSLVEVEVDDIKVVNEYPIFRDILYIVLAIAVLVISIVGFLVYRLVELGLRNTVERTAQEEGRKYLVRVLTLEGFCMWQDYERVGKQLINLFHVEGAIDITKGAYKHIRDLDDKKGDVELLKCHVLNNLSYYLAERKRFNKEQEGDAELAIGYKDYIKKRIHKYPEYAVKWSDTCKFVEEQFR